MVDDRVSDRRATADHDVEPLRRQAAVLDEQLGELDRAERGLPRRLQDDRATGRDRRGDLVRDQVEREVERRDRTDHTDRTPHREPDLALAGRDRIERNEVAVERARLGGGSTVGNAIVDHPDVALITFTGSPEVGWGIRSRAARKRVGLELGNNAPVIIEPDSDWSSAATKIRAAGFSHAGQSCISTQRVLVHRSIIDEFTDSLVKEVSTLVVGDPLDEATEVSALISTSERERVKSWVDAAVAAGATVACGGEIDDNGVLMPTVLTNVTSDMEVCRNEVFGPVVAVAAYDTLDEAIRIANDTRYGLQAAIFTNRVADAMKAFQSLDFGGVLVNEVPTWRADQQPYGGLRDSGNTREGPAYAIKEMTELRMVVLGP